ncbi:MAG TPA: allantoate amidohydrolase [Acidobacteriaceae bacterium]|nr:allantoate amidohydrolase [Acidobacteriaceae bacterium]
MSESSSYATLSRAQQIIARCRELALCSEAEGETTRTFLAPSMHRVHALLSGWMKAAGMQVRIDAAGNLRGVLPAEAPGAPRILIGSHLDTVADAGAFDGVLGVVLGVSLVEDYIQQVRAGLPSAAQLPFSIEVIGFSEEEGVRFAKPFLGSLALIGELDAATLARTDCNGVSVADAIRHFGLDPAELPATVVDDSACAYVEFHIEQGPVLDSEGLSLGVVHAIAGQTRMQLIFTGQANHAGTTPMGPLRRDALAAAAHWIVEVERYANGRHGLVATAGKLETIGGASNVIAGNAVVTLDVRHARDEIRHSAIAHFLDAAQTAASARGVTVTHSIWLDQPAVAMDSDLTALLADATTRAGHAVRLMTSGAGHDAMIVARRVPSALLFLRTPGGLSHHPSETVLPVDIEAALATGVEFLHLLRDDRAMLERSATGTSQRKREDIHA